MTTTPSADPRLRWVARVLCPALMSLVPAAVGASEGGLDAADYLSQLVGGLLVVVAAILVLAWVLRRMPGVSRQGQQAIEILAVRPIGARDRLMLVQVGEEQLLIAVGASGMRTLHRLRQNVDIQPPASREGEFSDLLKQALFRGRSR